MRAVKILVVGHHDVGVARYLEVLAGDALGLEGVNLAEKYLGINDTAVANHGIDALVHDARGHLVKGELVATSNDGVTGVRSTGVAADDVKLARDEVRHLTLALVAPLRTYEN